METWLACYGGKARENGEWADDFRIIVNGIEYGVHTKSGGPDFRGRAKDPWHLVVSPTRRLTSIDPSKEPTFLIERDGSWWMNRTTAIFPMPAGGYPGIDDVITDWKGHGPGWERQGRIVAEGKSWILEKSNAERLP